MINKKQVFRVFYWTMMIIFLLIGEPYENWRKPITEEQVINAIPKGYLPSFYEQMDELDFYFLDREFPISLVVGQKTACFLKSDYKFVFWKNTDKRTIYVINKPLATKQELLSSLSCLAHEIGHAIDFNNGTVSKTKEFEQAVELSIETCENGRNEPPSWCFLVEQFIAEYSGINGNPFRRTFWRKWGGYQELYADLYAFGFYLDMIPPPLRIYYQDYFPSFPNSAK